MTLVLVIICSWLMGLVTGMVWGQAKIHELETNRAKTDTP